MMEVKTVKEELCLDTDADAEGLVQSCKIPLQQV